MSPFLPPFTVQETAYSMAGSGLRLYRSLLPSNTQGTTFSDYSACVTPIIIGTTEDENVILTTTIVNIIDESDRVAPTLCRKYIDRLKSRQQHELAR